MMKLRTGEIAYERLKFVEGYIYDFQTTISNLQPQEFGLVYDEIYKELFYNEIIKEFITHDKYKSRKLIIEGELLDDIKNVEREIKIIVINAINKLADRMIEGWISYKFNMPIDPFNDHHRETFDMEIGRWTCFKNAINGIIV